MFTLTAAPFGPVLEDDFLPTGEKVTTRAGTLLWKSESTNGVLRGPMKHACTWRKALVVGVLLIAALPAHAQLATWELNGLLDSADPVPVTTVDSQVTAGALTISPVLQNTTFSNAFVAIGWPLGALDPAKYMQFSIAPKPGMEVSYSELRFSLYNNFAGISSWELRSSVDNYQGTLASGTETQIFGVGAPVNADISALGTRSGSVSFRLYTFGNSGTAPADRRGLRGSGTGGQDLQILGDPSLASAAPNLAFWDLTGTIDSSTPVPVATTAPGVTAGVLSSAGLVPALFANAFVSSGWPLGALDSGRYFAFTVAPTSSDQIAYDEIVFSLYNNFEGTSDWELRSSADGYASVLAAGGASVIFGSGSPVVADISVLGTRAGPVTFRFYSFNNTGSNGPDRRGFRGSAAGNGLDLSVNGSLILTPGGDADLDGLSNGDEIGIYFTDPLDADTDDDGLNDGEEVALATDPNNPDHDGDTICDGSGTGGGSCTAGPDNCPFISNLSQTNSDALEAGDDCQCGDVNRDNAVTALDLTIVRQNLVGAALSGSFDASRCDFDGDPGCGVDDAFVLDRILKGAPTPSVNACPAYGSNPGLSCLDIQNRGLAAGDGKYMINLPSGTVAMHCDFGSDSGGWTRVAALDTSVGFCGNTGIADMRADPDASMGRIPDSDVQALMTQTPGSPMELMYYSRTDGRYLWHELETVNDYDTSTKHISSSFYCTNWRCDDGSTDSSACGSEGNGCPVTAHGIPFFTKKIYVDSSFGAHVRGLHITGNMCGMPEYTRAAIWIYVR